MPSPRSARSARVTVELSNSSVGRGHSVASIARKSSVGRTSRRGKRRQHRGLLSPTLPVRVLSKLHPVESHFTIAPVRSIRSASIMATRPIIRLTRPLKDPSVTGKSEQGYEASQASAAATRAFVPVSSVG